MTIISIIFATTPQFDFSKKDGGLPWPPVSSDMTFFKNITIGNGNNAVIMGKNTFDTLNNKPLPKRSNIIVSKSLYDQRQNNLKNNHNLQAFDFSYYIKQSLEDALNFCKNRYLTSGKGYDEVFIIGGSSLIQEALNSGKVDNIYINIISGEVIKYIDINNSIKFYYSIPSYFQLSDTSYTTTLSTLENKFHTQESEYGYNIEFQKYINLKKIDEHSVFQNENKNLAGNRTPLPKNIYSDSWARYPLKNEISYLLNDLDYTYESWGEEAYRNLIKKILKNGKERDDRTRTGTLSLFGEYLTFDVSKYFPLLTLKKVYWKGVVEELLFFISGETDTKILENKGINIWKGNTSREFLDTHNLSHYKEGEMGAGYGYQWRHFGKDYISLSQKEQNFISSSNGNPDLGSGIDQLKEAIELIKNDPYSRRIMVSAWNPSDLSKMALPPCHYCFQFYVDDENLSLLVNMRSCDVFLGLPFNIASYGLLLYIIAHITNKKPKNLNFMLGDTHIYKNHIEQSIEILKRNVKKAPTLKINSEDKNIDNFKFEDFVLENYNPHSIIKAEMAV